MTVSPFAPALPVYVSVTRPDPQPDLWQLPLGTPVGAACDGSWNILDFVPRPSALRELTQGDALDRDRNATTSKSRGFDTPALPDGEMQAFGLPSIPTFWYEG